MQALAMAKKKENWLSQILLFYLLALRHSFLRLGLASDSKTGLIEHKTKLRAQKEQNPEK